MEHIIKFIPGYDCFKFECFAESKRCMPGSDGSHGKHGLQIQFVTKGEEGAVCFLLYTGWLPQWAANPHNIMEWGGSPLPADLGYHSKTPRYEEHSPASDSCEFCGGQPCYCASTVANASDAMYAFVNGGGEALWAFLEAYYAHVFHGKAYPQPAEYEKPPRQKDTQ